MRIWEGFQKGVNLGGWISQFAAYDPAHFESFITEKDIADIAALGFDHIRVPVDYNVLEDEEGRFRESGFGYLENCRRWCEARGLCMLIDLHECYGYSFDPLKKGMDRRRFFYDEALQRRFDRIRFLCSALIHDAVIRNLTALRHFFQPFHRKKTQNLSRVLPVIVFFYILPDRLRKKFFH